MRPCGSAELAIHYGQDGHPDQPALLNLVDEAQAVAAVEVAPPSPKAPQAAPGAPESDDEQPLYAARRQIYPQRVTGTFLRRNWALLSVTLGISYLLPLVR